MPDRSEDIARRASDNRFRLRREELVQALAALVGPRFALEPLANPDRAAALAAEVRAAYRAAERQAQAVVRCDWRADDRGEVVGVLHAVGAAIGPRPVWLVIPGREPQVVPLVSDVVLDNPLGFATLADDDEFTLFDQALPGGLTVTRHSHFWGHALTTYSWEVEAWGSEPWLSTLASALREVRDEPGKDAG